MPKSESPVVNGGPDHPEVAFGKIGVLIANLGTPGNYDYFAVRRYLSQFLSDRRVIDYSPWIWQPILQLIVLTKRPFSSGAAYRSIWNTEQNESPLLTITKEQTSKLAKRIKDKTEDDIVVDFCMRYGNPSTKSRLQRLLAAGCRNILFFPLYPQYSGATTATANDEFFRCLREPRWQPAVRTVSPYFDHPKYIQALAESVARAADGLDFTPDVFLASYHGLPKRYLTEGDPYHCHCQKTSRLLRKQLGLDTDRLVTSFQSRFGTEEWLQPYTVEEVAKLAKAGKTRIAVFAPGFSADCIETLEEIREEIRESFENAGGERFAYIPCLNASDSHIEMMADIALENLQGWVGGSGPVTSAA